MNIAASELQRAKDWLAKWLGINQWDYLGLVKYLEQFAGIFSRTSQEQHRAMMSEFHNCAGRLPYFQDRDIGALILESSADVSTNSELRSFLYLEARLRAIWCAQGATAGGEGLARVAHVQELEEKLRLHTNKTTPCPPPEA